MPARLHDDGCRAKLNGWGPGWADACDCASGQSEEQQRVLAASRPGIVVSIFRGMRPGIGVRFVVEDTDGRHAVLSAQQLVPDLTTAVSTTG